MTTYKVTRFRFTGGNTTIKRGLTLAEAQAHCQREDTHGGAGTTAWFDGLPSSRAGLASPAQTSGHCVH